MQERRRLTRTRIFACAKVVARHFLPPCDCAVANLTSLGARLEFASTTAIPNIFELTLDAGRTWRVCHVVWRTPTEMGVEFANPQSN
jgi:hypothetical protein